MIYKTFYMTKKEITQLSYEIVGCAIKVHKKLGPGLLESIYEECLKYELSKKGFDVKQQVPIKIEYDELILEKEYRFDLLVNDCIVVELKTVDKFEPIHEAILLTYMNILEVPQGLLINFKTTTKIKSNSVTCDFSWSKLDGNGDSNAKSLCVNISSVAVTDEIIDAYLIKKTIGVTTPPSTRSAAHAAIANPVMNEKPPNTLAIALLFAES